MQNPILRNNSCQGKRTFRLVQKDYLFHFSETRASDSFFSVWQKSVFQRNSLFRLLKTDFLASGNRFLLVRDFGHFLGHQSTAAGGSSFPLSGTYWKSGNKFFAFWKQYCFIPSFFLLVEYYYSNGEEVNFYRRTRFLLVVADFFEFFRDFLKWKQLFSIVKTYFQQILYPASGNGYSVQWKQCFMIRTIFLLMKLEENRSHRKCLFLLFDN